MAEVPVYGPRKQTLRPVFTGKMDSRATPDAFGAGIGRAMQNVASGISQAGDALAAVQEMEDKAIVEDRVNQFSDFARNRTYDPESGYVNQLGQNAVSGRQQFETDLEAQRTALGKDLSPAQQKMFNRATEARRRQAYDTGIKHASAQRRKWFDDAATARLETFAEDALAMADEPEKLALNLAAAQKEIADRAALNGWAPEQTAAAQEEFLSGVHKNIVLKHAIADPMRAKQWLDANRDKMTQAHQFDLDKALDAPVLESHAQIEAERILQGGDRPRDQVNSLGRPDMRVRTANNSVDFEGLKPDTKTAFGRLQTALGRQLLVTSAYRSPEANKAAGGAKFSQHMQGTAIDVDIRGMSKAERLDLIAKAFDAGFTGIGVGSNILHIDQGSPRAWGYVTSSGGGPVPDYAAALINERLGQLNGKAPRQQTQPQQQVQQTGNFDGWTVGRAGKGFTEFVGPDGKVQRRTGTRAWRNNNPGNIEYGKFAKAHGAIGTDGRFAVFPSYQAGRAAKEQLLFNSTGYSGKTLAQAITRYAPHFENDTNGYIGTVARDTGVDPNTPLSALSPQQRVRMLDAMERVEGFSAGQTQRGQQIPGYVGPQYIADQVAHISDPRLRAKTAAALTRMYNAQDASERRAQRQNKLAAERWIIENPGADPTKLPLEIQQQLGIDGMNTLWSYNDRIAQAGAVQTDEQLYAELQRLQAEDPHQFAEDVDLFDYIDRLSTKDRRELQQLQVDAIKDRREGTEKALTEAKSISTAMSIAGDRLEAAGIRKTGKAANDESRTREAQFQRALIDRMREFQAKEERVPNDYEVSDMVDQLLLPIIIKEPGMLWGTNDEEAFVFEAPFGLTTLQLKSICRTIRYQ